MNKAYSEHSSKFHAHFEEVSDLTNMKLGKKKSHEIVTINKIKNSCVTISLI